jgi:ABC-type multidrug transport system ATPase subunit
MRLLEVRSLTRRFGDVTAVDGVDLVVGSGEVVGLIGANGAGKTTLIRMILGLLRPTEGAVSLFGEAPSRAGRKRIGYVPQGLGLYDDLSVSENMRFVSAAFGIGASGLGDLAIYSDTLVGSLPRGAQRRLAFAAALSHRPELLVLDEPTSGVGPIARARLWDDIRGTAESIAGVLVTTHHMSEAEQCDRVVVMAAGRIVAEGTLEEIVGSDQVVAVTSEDWARAFGVLDDAAFSASLVGRSVHVIGATAPEVERLLAEQGLEASVGTARATFEEAFVRLSTAQGG